MSIKTATLNGVATIEIARPRRSGGFTSAAAKRPNCTAELVAPIIIKPRMTSKNEAC